MLDYAKNNTKSFAECPFNRVDALILAWLSYFAFPSFLKSCRKIKLKHLPKRELLPAEEMYASAYNPEGSKQLFDALTQNPRFGNMALSDYVEIRDEDNTEQFAAICVEIEPNVCYLSFRGTDTSFVGWKEDFNLAILAQIPSQTDAAKYARKIMRRKKNAQFYFGGHSKGGNLAVYALAKTRRDDLCRVVSAYSFDGPGIAESVYLSETKDMALQKIVKVVPQASFVGMLFESGTRFEVVKSKNKRLLQHDPFSWQIENDDFVSLSQTTQQSVKAEKAFNKWIADLTLEEKSRFAAIVFDALGSLNLTDMNAFLNTVYKQLPVLGRRYRSLQAEDKRLLKYVLRQLLHHFWAGFFGKSN